MQTIGMADFRSTAQGGLVLQAFNLTEIIADPGAEGTRNSQISIALNEMREGMGFKGGRANYSVPAQAVFTRFVKLPTVGAEKVEQIIQFEAQQNVPFPIDEVVWDYQLVASQSAGQMEVVLVAIKADMLEDLNDTIEESKFDTGVVDVAPMALYNAFRYNYSDMTGCSLLIDVGARTTNLVFVDSGRIFSRSIPIGGTAITQAIAKDLGEPFQVCEGLKKSGGFVGLGGSFQEPDDEQTARIAKVIRNSMTRLHAEIARSISFYRSQQQGAPPVRVFLCGGSVSMPYTREFFAEKLNLPIEFFNPLRNVSVGSGVDAEEAGKSAHVLGELIGLALRNVSACPMELSLEPASVKRTKVMARKAPLFAMAGICALLSVIAWWLYNDAAAKAYEGALQKIEPQVARLSGVETKFNALKKDMQKAKDDANPLLSSVSDRDYWVRIIDEVNSQLPLKYVWVTSFETGRVAGKNFTPQTVGKKGGAPEVPAQPAAGGPPGQAPKAPEMGIRLQGLYLDNPKEVAVVDEFVANLKKSELFSEVEAPVRTPKNMETWAYSFEIVAKLKTPTSPAGTP